MTLRYISTRGGVEPVSFLKAAQDGLAPDGGLYVPEHLPRLSPEDLEAVRHEPYAATALRVMRLFIGDEIPESELSGMISQAYTTFETADIAPLRDIGEGHILLELFHGPTLAFKDVALQFLGRLFARQLAQSGRRATVLGATSGDTGSAAIAAFRGIPGVEVVILHPKGRISDVQRRQMTTVADANIRNVAIEGDFDDCQRLVKALFADADFKARMNLTAVNSINWARILAQVVYYVRAAARLEGRAPVFCVPTGNFGNIYAGYVARAIGAPMSRLLAATNANDILHRFFETGEMAARSVTPTLSPSMDIQVSSNAERLIFDLVGRSGARVSDLMKDFAATGSFRLNEREREKGFFASGRADDAETLETLKWAWSEKGILIDPHTAVGLSVARRYLQDHPGGTVVTLATAHPAKFPDAVRRATGETPPQPPALSALHGLSERSAILPPDLETLKSFMRSADV